MRALSDSIAPYQVRISSGAQRQLKPLARDVSHRIRAKLGQLAELSALTLGYVQSLPERAVLNAEEQGFAIRYEVDDAHRTLTAIEISKRQTGTRGD